MTEQEVERKSYTIYQEFYRQICLWDDWVFEPQKVLNVKSLMKNYTEWLNERFKMPNSKAGLHRVDVEFLVKVFSYGFNYWVWRIEENPKKYAYGIDGIKFNWIIGKEALKRFDRNEETFDKMSWARNIKKAYNTVLYDIKKTGTDNARAFVDLYIKVNESEELEKDMFHNTTEGLIWCKANTTLFNHKSKLCTGCNNRTRCKDLLKEYYPVLYKQRGYNGR